jgi:hypothetical protein
MVGVQMRQEQRVDVGPATSGLDEALGHARAAIDEKSALARAHQIGRTATRRVALQTPRSQQHDFHRRFSPASGRGGE